MLVAYEQSVALHIAEYTPAEKNPFIEIPITTLYQHQE